MIALLWLLLAILALPFKSKCRLEAENAALRHQVMVLRRQAHSRIQLTNFDRLFLVQLYHWFRRSCGSWPSSSRRRSFVGIGPAFAATGVGNRVRGEGGHRLMRGCALWSSK
jgi:hypothetical protein